MTKNYLVTLPVRRKLAKTEGKIHPSPFYSATPEIFPFFCFQPFQSYEDAYLTGTGRSIDQRRITPYTFPYSVCFRPQKVISDNTGGINIPVHILITATVSFSLTNCVYEIKPLLSGQQAFVLYR